MALLFALFGLVAVVLLLDPVAGADQCRGMDMKEYEPETLWRTECMKEFDAKTPMEAMMIPCFRKCMLIKRGVVDDMGNPNKERAIELVKLMAPDPLADELSLKAGDCVDMHAAKVKEGNMSCESYVPTCQCLVDAFIKTCSQ